MEQLVSEGVYNDYSFKIWSYPDDDYPAQIYYYYRIYSYPIIESANFFESVSEALKNIQEDIIKLKGEGLLNVRIRCYD